MKREDYIKTVVEMMSKYVPENPVTDMYDKRIVELAKSRMTTLADYKALVQPWFDKPNKKVPKALEDLVCEFYVFMECVKEWNVEKIQNFIKTGNKKDWKERGRGLTVLFTGQDRGLPVPNMLALIGYFETQKRINILLKTVKQKERSRIKRKKK